MKAILGLLSPGRTARVQVSYVTELAFENERLRFSLPAKFTPYGLTSILVPLPFFFLFFFFSLRYGRQPKSDDRYALLPILCSASATPEALPVRSTQAPPTSSICAWTSTCLLVSRCYFFLVSIRSPVLTASHSGAGPEPSNDDRVPGGPSEGVADASSASRNTQARPSLPRSRDRPASPFLFRTDYLLQIRLSEPRVSRFLFLSLFLFLSSSL
jgi:hypothetical protein